MVDALPRIARCVTLVLVLANAQLLGHACAQDGGQSANLSGNETEYLMEIIDIVEAAVAIDTEFFRVLDSTIEINEVNVARDSASIKFTDLERRTAGLQAPGRFALVHTMVSVSIEEDIAGYGLIRSWQASWQSGGDDDPQAEEGFLRLRKARELRIVAAASLAAMGLPFPSVDTSVAPTHETAETSPSSFWLSGTDSLS